MRKFLLALSAAAGLACGRPQEEAMGVGEAWRSIEQCIAHTDGEGYEYATRDAHERIAAGLRALAGPTYPDASHMAFAVDRLLFLLSHDPSAVVRAEVCDALGRLLPHLPAGESGVPDPHAPFRVHQAAQRLVTLEATEANAAEITALLRTIAAAEPETLLGARQAVRVFAARPVANADVPAIREAREELAPVVARAAITAALREVENGNGEWGFSPDRSPLVRGAATEARR